MMGVPLGVATGITFCIVSCSRAANLSVGL